MTIFEPSYRSLRKNAFSDNSIFHEAQTTILNMGYSQDQSGILSDVKITFRNKVYELDQFLTDI